MKLARLAAFTNLGKAVRRLPEITDRLDGKTVLITGATRGLGRAAAEQMAVLGADVVLVGRSESGLDRARVEIACAADSHDIATEIADLSSMQEVHALADRLLDHYPQIDVLVNNAGALFPERATTSEGLERTFALNVLSPYLLTERLIPRLIESAPSRIITVSSGGMYGQRLEPEDLQSQGDGYRGAAAYARAKRAQVVLTEIWAERLAPEGVTVHAMHPGWADTPGVQSSLPTFRTLMRPLLRSPEAGADTITWLAASPEAAETTGRFWLDRSPQPTHLVSRTEERPGDRQALIDRLEEYTASVR